MATPTSAPLMARPRVAAGALLMDERGRVLLVHPTYKDTWDIPGGYVEPGESPQQACRRELSEELGVDLPVGRLLVVDWAPDDEGDKLLFVYAGSRLGDQSIRGFTLQRDEIDEVRFFISAELPLVLNQRLLPRIRCAIQAAAETRTISLINGAEPLTGVA